MGVGEFEFESFEKQFLDIIGEFHSLSISETRLRDSLRAESSRAETAEASLAAAERAAVEARAGAAAATAGATQAVVAALAKAHDELNAVRIQKDVADRQRCLLEERCSELSMQLETTERELQQLRPLQVSYTSLQRQYQELYERVSNATELARTETIKLENELRKVEKCAGGGTEVRERARLAAAAHVRERKLAAAELQHTLKELFQANAEIARLHVLVKKIQHQISELNSGKSPNTAVSSTIDSEALAEARAALESERAGTAKLERALAAALKHNATQATKVHAEDAPAITTPTSTTVQTESPKIDHSTTKLNALDSFLAD